MNQLYESESRNAIPGQRQRMTIQLSHRLSLLALGAIAGQIFLLASIWLLPSVSGFSPIRDNISELVSGRYGFVQTFALVLSGLGTLGLAYAIRQLTEGVWGSRIGSLLIVIYGVGSILLAIFPADATDNPANLGTFTATGAIHAFVDLGSFLSVIVGMVVLAWTFSYTMRWHSRVIWAAILATAAVSLLVAQISAQQGPWAGLVQRALVTVIAGWLIWVALGVRSIATTGEAENQAGTP